MVLVTHQASKDNPQSLASPVQSDGTRCAIAQPSTYPLTLDECKAVADGWTALPVKSMSCSLLGFSQQLDIPLSEPQPYLQHTLSKIPSLQVTDPIGAPMRRLVLELGKGKSLLEQALVAYFSKRVLYTVERSILSGLTLQLSSAATIQIASDLLAVVESGGLEISLSRCSVSDWV